MATVEKRQFTICDEEIDSKYDVMLSYQWDSKQEIIELEKALQKKGLLVWRDDTCLSPNSIPLAEQVGKCFI